MVEIRKQLSADLKIAMKERNDLAVRAIRSLMSALDNAGAVSVAAPEVMPMAGGIAGATEGIGSTEVPRKELSEGEIQEIIRKEIDEMAKAAQLMKSHSRPEAGQLVEQIKILEKYRE